MFNDVNIVFKGMSELSNKGFINNPKINLPFVKIMVDVLKIDVVEDVLKIDVVEENDKFDASILMNTLLYNLLLMILYTMIIKIEK